MKKTQTNQASKHVSTSMHARERERGRGRERESKGTDKKVQKLLIIQGKNVHLGGESGGVLIVESGFVESELSAERKWIVYVAGFIKLSIDYYGGGGGLAH